MPQGYKTLQTEPQVLAENIMLRRTLVLIIQRCHDLQSLPQNLSEDVLILANAALDKYLEDFDDEGI